ncbi:MAG: D-aminoacyl-tRNA deacylase [Nanoarchaeota archaeon]
MKYIVVSETNKASRNVGKFILEKDLPKNTNVIKTKNSVLELESDLKSIKDAEIVIVASSHKSEAGLPMLNAHFTGNFGEDVSHGGARQTLSIASALYQRAAVLEYAKLQAEDGRLSGYRVGIEATHHGPTLDLPIIFVEVGSTEEQWGDLVACEAAAKVILKLVSSAPEKVPVAVGFGGGHYCPQFTKKLFEEGFAFGHICPKYAAGNLTEDVILQLITKTTPKPEKVLVEWNGLSSKQRKNIISVLEQHEILWGKA